MKIICTVTNDLSHDQRMDRICCSLQAAGHQVTLVGRLRPDSKPLPEKLYQQYRIRCKYDHGKSFYLEYNWRLVRELRQWEYDAICSVDVDTLAAGAALTRSDRHQLVFDAHEWFHMTPEVVDRPLIRGFWKGLAKMLMPKTDLRYTVAPQLAGKLSEDYGSPFNTVRNLPRFSPPFSAPATAPNAKKVILYQGMLNPGRGLEVGIAAMDRLPTCELWIAGSGPEKATLIECKSKLKAPERVKFLGFVSPEKLPELTAKAWLGLNLLEAHSPSYYYSLANKALDYVQAGLPSVQMDFPEYMTLQEEYGCYLILKDLHPQILADRIQTLVVDSDEYERMASACRLAAKELCWEREEQILLSLWNKLP